MVRLTFIHTENNHVNDHVFSIPLGICLFIVVSAIVALCANHGKRASRKEVSKSSIDNIDNSFQSVEEDRFQEKIPPRSPLRSPKQLIATISNKATSSFIINHKRDGGDGGKVEDEGFGQGGLWQKEILMGVKCQPPEFSGVIYYDCDGHQVSEFPPKSPRSPRIARSPDFTFPMVKSSV